MFRFYRMSRGALYASAYRASMGFAACIRLLLLAAMFPFGDKTTIRYAIAKWRTVFKWALGLDQVGIGA
jgi:hypothetical protein